MRFDRRRWVRTADVAATATLLCAHACNDVDASRSSVAPLVAAAEDPSDRAVVAIRHGAFGAFCTGVLVAPRVVLTAKHCVQPSGASEPFAANEFTVESTPPDSSNSRDAVGASVVGVHSVQTTPGAWSESPTGPIGALRGVDVAVLVLDHAIDVVSFDLAFDLAPLSVGDDARVIAMGGSIDAGPGTRRALDVRVQHIDGNLLTTDGRACDGDSGGPLIDRAGHVRGILSSGASPCGTEGIEFDGIDVLRVPIEAALAETGALSSVDAAVEPNAVVVAAGGCAVRSDQAPNARSIWIVFTTLMAWALTRRTRTAMRRELGVSDRRIGPRVL